jgi:prophage regulatory protein
MADTAKYPPHTRHFMSPHECAQEFKPDRRSMRILRVKELATKLNCSQSTIRNRINPASRWHDPTFPRPFELGPKGLRCVAMGWLEYVIDEWLEARARAAQEAPHRY